MRSSKSQQLHSQREEEELADWERPTLRWPVFSRPEFCLPGLLKNWEQLLLLGLLIGIIGMITALLLPHPQAVISLKPYAVSGEVVALAEQAPEVATDDSAVESESAAPTDVKKHAGKKHPRHAATPKKPKHPPVLNMNTATLSQWQLLPGIGPKMAERVLEYRKGNGPFKDPAQIMEVKGIGPKKFEKMKAFLRV